MQSVDELRRQTNLVQQQVKNAYMVQYDLLVGLCTRWYVDPNPTFLSGCS